MSIKMQRYKFQEPDSKKKCVDRRMRSVFGIWNLQYGISSASGFTLVEAMVALSLFAVISTAAISGVVSAERLARRSQASALAFENVSYALENMSRLIKIGSLYHCGASGVLTVPQDCPTAAESTFAFKGDDGKNYLYDLVLPAGYIRRASCTAPCTPIAANGVPVTSPSAALVKKLSFYVTGSGTNENPPQQARVLVLMQGEVNSDTGPIPFNIQTSLSQRKLDN